MDLTSVQTIRDIQKRFGFSFKKGFGQNFLTSRETLDAITDAVRKSGARCAVEIGPGFGTLTSALCEGLDAVAAIELDKSLLDVLDFTLAEYDNVRVINADALKTDIAAVIAENFSGKPAALAANLPYYAATQIIVSLIEKRPPLTAIVVMVQKEVAERICAAPGTKSYGTLSVLCGYFTEPEIVAQVTADKFVPPPKVDSTVIRLTPRRTPAVCVRDEEMLFKTVKAAFSQRRKTLANCLASSFGCEKESVSALLEALDIAPSRRGETLSLAEFAVLSDALCDFLKK